MKISLIYQEDYPWDIRVEKVANVLLSAGHDVLVICRNESRKKRNDTIGRMKIHRLPYLPKIFGKLNETINFPAFFNPLWVFSISKCVRENKIDVLIVRDLPLALTAIFVGRHYKIPVLLDMAECYPELLRSIWKFGKFKVRNLLVRNPFFADIVEKISIRKAHHIFVMVEESKDRLIAKGALPSRISIVGNSPPVNKFTIDSECSKRKENERIHLIYVGLITKGRGLDTVIEGISFFQKQHGISVLLTVIGTGEAEVEYKKKASDLGLGDIVDFKGWMENAIIGKFLRTSDVGLVSHHVCSHWNNTVPNKLFDYMANGIPVLSSNTSAVARILRETKAGLIYEDFSPESFSEALLKLTSNTKRHKLGANGLKAVLERYNWENESSILIQTINKMAA